MARVFISFWSGIKDLDNKSNSCPIACFYESFIKGLQDAGNQLFVFCHQDHDVEKDIPKELLFKLKKFDPEILILFNNSFYDVADLFECPIVIYDADSVLFYANKDKIRQRPDRYKFVTSQLDSIEVLQNFFGVTKKNIGYVPYFSAVSAESIPIVTNISFIGSSFTSSGTLASWNLFQKERPDLNELQQFKLILDEISLNPYVKKEHLINKLNISSSKILKNIDINNLITMLSSANRIQVLSEIADLGLDLYGNEEWGTDLQYHPELSLNYINQSIYTLKQNQDIYNSSKICININHLQAKSGFSWRVCDVMASNGCLLSEYKPDLIKHFPKIDIPTFTNKFEARELCIKLLKNENMRRDIVAQSQEIINSHYRIDNFLCELEGFIGINLRNNLILDKEQSENYILEIQNKKITSKPLVMIYLGLLFYNFLFFFTLIPGSYIFLKKSKILNKIKRKFTQLQQKENK